MRSASTKRIVGGALAGILGGVLAVGTLMAQVAAPSPAAQAPESVFGVWSAARTAAGAPDCALRSAGAGMLLSISREAFVMMPPNAGAMVFGVSYRGLDDGVGVTINRVFAVTGRAAGDPWEGGTLVVRAEGNTLRWVRTVTSAGGAGRSMADAPSFSRCS